MAQMPKEELIVRELAVYYCPKCGYYGFYQLPRNAVCPKCSLEMTLLDMTYRDFVNLDYRDRDELLSSEIIASSSPVVHRMMTSHKAFNQRELIAKLCDKIDELEKENKQLNTTVDWMHQTIWDLIRKNKKP